MVTYDSNQRFLSLVPGGNGVFYAVQADGQLIWYRHSGWATGAATWANGGNAIQVGAGWGDTTQKLAVSNTNGTVYTIALDTTVALGNDSSLMWYQLRSSEAIDSAAVAWGKGGNGVKVGSGFTQQASAALQGYPRDTEEQDRGTAADHHLPRVRHLGRARSVHERPVDRPAGDLAAPAQRHDEDQADRLHQPHALQRSAAAQLDDVQRHRVRRLLRRHDTHARAVGHPPGLPVEQSQAADPDLPAGPGHDARHPEARPNPATSGSGQPGPSSAPTPWAG
jgi:hypothetical protein